jgi:hypothetical protein
LQFRVQGPAFGNDGGAVHLIHPVAVGLIGADILSSMQQNDAFCVVKDASDFDGDPGKCSNGVCKSGVLVEVVFLDLKLRYCDQFVVDLKLLQNLLELLTIVSSGNYKGSFDYSPSK